MQSKGVLVLSLCLNLGLLGAWAHYAKSQPNAEAPSPNTSSPAAPVSKAPPSLEPDTPATNTPATTNAPAAQFTWRSVEAADYKEYIANLRGIGCPEETIRDIIVADVNKLYAPRFAALRKPAVERKYWLRDAVKSKADVERIKQLAAVTEEMDALLRDLLGIDQTGYRNQLNGSQERLDRELDFLPAEKRAQAKALIEQYEMAREKMQNLTGGNYDEDDADEFKKLYKTHLTEMAQFMTPEEIFEYRLRTSGISSTLKYRMSLLDPSEAEFRGAFRIQSALEDTQSQNGDYRDDPEANKRMQAARRKADDEMKSLLGDERYAEYQRGLRYDYNNLVEIGSYLGFDKAAAAKVYDMKKPLQEQAKQIRNDKTISAEQRDAALNALRAQADREIIAVIGEKGFKAYRRQGGSWLGNLDPPRNR